RGSLHLVFLKSGRGVELAGTAAAAALIDRASPGVLLEVDALLRLENACPADGCHRRQRRGKAARRRLVEAAGVGAVITAPHEVRHAQRDRAVLDRGVDVAGAAGSVGLA